MTDKPTSIVDIHTQKVNEHCAALCQEQLDILTGTAFEDFAEHLRSGWLAVFENLGMGEDELLPVIQASVHGDMICFYSAMVCLQFTNRPVPVAIDNIDKQLFSCAEWYFLKGDGACVGIDLGIEKPESNKALFVATIDVIVKDIFKGYDDDKCPAQLVTFLCHVVIYHYVRNWVYVGSEYGIVREGHDNPVTKVTFTNGLKTSEIYINAVRAQEDWDDFVNRHDDHYKEMGVEP